MKGTLVLVLAAVLLLGAAGIQPAAAQTTGIQYRFMDIGTLGGRETVPYQINDRNEIIGQSQLANGEWHMFLWRYGIMHDLGPGEILGINNETQIAGNYQTNTGEWRGFFGLFGIHADIGPYKVRALNEAGQVLGTRTSGGLLEFFVYSSGQWSKIGELDTGWEPMRCCGFTNQAEVTIVFNTDGMWHPFLLRNGEFIDLFATVNSDGEVSAINRPGQVAINSWDPNRGYIWTAGRLEEMETPSNMYGNQVWGLSNKGFAAGQVLTSDTGLGFPAEWLAAVWQPEGQVTMLRTWSGYQSMAYGINSWGIIVGDLKRITDPTTGASKHKAVIWPSSTSPMTLLPLPKGYVESRARQISYASGILGSATLYNGAKRAVFWKPVAAP